MINPKNILELAMICVDMDRTNTNSYISTIIRVSGYSNLDAETTTLLAAETIYKLARNNMDSTRITYHILSDVLTI